MEEKLVELAEQLDIPVDILVEDMQHVGVRNSALGAIIFALLFVIGIILIIISLHYFKGTIEKPMYDDTEEHDYLYTILIISGALFVLMSLFFVPYNLLNLSNWLCNPLAMTISKIFGA